MEPLATLVARICLSAVFLYSGFAKLFDVTGAYQEVTGLGLPMPWIALSITLVAQIGGGLMLLIGWHARLGGAIRADAVSALEKIKNDDEVVSALGNALHNDKFWGLRATAADALGQIGSPAASKQLLEALESASEPWVRNRIVAALGNFKGDSALGVKLTEIAKDDSYYRASAAALQALGKLKSPGTLATLEAAVSGDSPDGYIRNAALRALGTLGDDKAVRTPE